MDLVATVRKEGSRGGRGDFKWSDVQTSQHRENYLGHSLMAPVGRWQRGRDLGWYAKGDSQKDEGGIVSAEAKAKTEREEEIQRIKNAEQDALNKALGYSIDPLGPLGPDPGPGTGANSTTLKPARESYIKESENSTRSERRRRPRSRSRSRSPRSKRDRPHRRTKYHSDHDHNDRHHRNHTAREHRRRSKSRSRSRSSSYERRRPLAKESRKETSFNSHSKQHRRRRESPRSVSPRRPRSLSPDSMDERTLWRRGGTFGWDGERFYREHERRDEHFSRRSRRRSRSISGSRSRSPPKIRASERVKLIEKHSPESRSRSPTFRLGKNHRDNGYKDERSRRYKENIRRGSQSP